MRSIADLSEARSDTAPQTNPKNRPASSAVGHSTIDTTASARLVPRPRVALNATKFAAAKTISPIFSQNSGIAAY
jgi:hypothetical protein